MTEPHPSLLSVLAAPICCATDPAPPGTRFHCAINVADLARSIEFYRILFGVRPAKRHTDYAKFELARPPLVFSLIPHPPGLGRTLRHFALPVHHPSEVETLCTRLATAGLAFDWKRNVAFDDAQEHAAELTDPDGNRWRIVCRLSDRDSLNDPSSPLTVAESREFPQPPSPVGWEHRIIAPSPDRIPHADDALDFVRLEGTFNADFTAQQRSTLLAEAIRVLKPSGVLNLHGLVSNRDLPACPVLSGVAALVRRVPTNREVLSELGRAGFVNLRLTKFPAKPAYRWDDVELRELKLSAWKPAVAAGEMQTVIYRGPFARVVTDSGRTFVRGVPAEVDAATRTILEAEPWTGQFLAPLDSRTKAEAVHCTTPAANRNLTDKADA